MALPEGVTLVDSFPFDSNPELVTSVNGYLRGDRSVDAWTMQRTFAQFFSDGVFGTPANALQIRKADSGLAVTIQPGMFIINGGMGGIIEDPVTLAIDTGAVAGNRCYSIMLRYDNNADMRSLGFRVAKGEAGASPQPPMPDTTSENVVEYRLGYVTLQNGATDMSNAVVTNEKGSGMCPYAAPFDEIDLSEITADARDSAKMALEDLVAYFETYRDTIDAALSDEEATHLQQQINALEAQIEGAEFADKVDDVTLEFAAAPGEDVQKLRVKGQGVDTDQLADFGVTSVKLDAELQVKLGIVDTTGWQFNQYEQFIMSLSETARADFIEQIDGGVVSSWSEPDFKELYSELDSSSRTALMGKLSIESYSWAQVKDLAQSVGADGRPGLVGKTKKTTILSKSATLVVIGCDHDDVDGGKSLLTLAPNAPVGSSKYNDTDPSSGRLTWGTCTLHSYVNNTVLPSLPPDLQTLLLEADVKYNGLNDSEVVDADVTATTKDKAWALSAKETYGNTSGYSKSEGSRYEWFASGHTFNGTGWTRTLDMQYNSSYITTHYGILLQGGAWGTVGDDDKKIVNAADHGAFIAFCI